MLRTRTCLAAAALLALGLQTASAQSTTAPASTDAKPSRMHLTMQKLKDMKAKWATNKPKLKACRAEVRKQGLTGDDRWFYIEDCMNKS
jgi:hypothetical protein